MLSITFRVLLVYILLLLAMRIMGKREIGQLSNLDFVVAIVVAELATLPLTDHSLSLLHSILPMLIITALQVTASVICLKSNCFRRFLYGRPNVLIAGGRLQMEEMRRARYNIDDLLSQLRQRDVFDVANVDYAVLEISGDLTVVLKPWCCPATRGDLNISTTEQFSGMPLTLIDDGEVNWKGLAERNLSKEWLQEQLLKNNIANPQDVFFASLSNNGYLYFISREEAMQTREKFINRLFCSYSRAGGGCDMAIQLLAGLLTILIGAELFTNGVEWLGNRLGLSEGTVGNLLAAVGTALPESIIPLVAFLGGNPASMDIGIGAILGAPFMLGTLAMFVTGFSAWLLRKERRGILKVDAGAVSRDLRMFLLMYLLAVSAAFYRPGANPLWRWLCWQDIFCMPGR